MGRKVIQSELNDIVTKWTHIKIYIFYFFSIIMFGCLVWPLVSLYVKKLNERTLEQISQVKKEKELSKICDKQLESDNFILESGDYITSIQLFNSTKQKLKSFPGNTWDEKIEKLINNQTPP